MLSKEDDRQEDRSATSSNPVEKEMHPYLWTPSISGTSPPEKLTSETLS